MGRALKEKREALGISLPEASSRTQIKLEFLQLLEEETFDLLPDPSYLGGFLRRYALFLGLDANALVQAFHEQISRPLIAKFEPIQRGSPSGWKERRPSFLILSSILVLALFLLLINSISHRTTKKVSSSPPAMAPSVRVVSPGEVKEKPPSPPVTERGAQPPVKEEGHTLSLLARERTWLLIQADNDPAREILLLQGESVSLSARRQFLLTLGNAGGVEMVLDGKRLPLAGSSGQVVRDLVLPPP